MVPVPAQYHHYIPRFILRTFADNFSLIKSNTEYIATSTPGIFEPIVKQGGGKKGKTSRGRKGRGGSAGGGAGGGGGGAGGGGGRQAGAGPPPREVSHHINVYQAVDYTTELNDTSRAYGIYDMYRDIIPDKEMRFEKLLGNLESTSATFIRKIWSGEDLSLTRVQLADMKKFLCIMMYRGEHRWRQYHDGLLDFRTLMSVKLHMKNNNIENVQDVWFDNLKWLIETPISDIMDEYQMAESMGPKNPFENPFMTTTEHKSPIHDLELLDFGRMAQNFVCVWHTQEGSEFILSDNCFGAFEGDNGIPFHNFFIVSPRYAIVLVNRFYMHTPGMLAHSFKKSWFSEKLHLSPQTVYMKGPPPPLRGIALKAHFSPNDVFKYTRIVIPKEDVYKVNSIFLDCRKKYLTYKSTVCMLKSLRFYDKVKSDEVLFTYEHDYTILKRKLFADLNRTHSS
ncbi:MAG: hypothetical protein J3R72DRAFT_488360 [Linnemannia gamsii]|nr:MAG: hypothetical protein J3R72DRAFT_488360 [Linnemannia gamsii]